MIKFKLLVAVLILIVNPLSAGRGISIRNRPEEDFVKLIEKVYLHSDRDISSGRYKLRAYTNYMRNFSEQLLFTKEITVINASEEPKRNSEEVEYEKNKITLNFFPEGGSLFKGQYPRG